MTRLKDLAAKCGNQKMDTVTDNGTVTALQLVRANERSFAKYTEGGHDNITALSFTPKEGETADFLKNLTLGKDAQALQYLYLSGCTALESLVFEPDCTFPYLTHLYLDGCNLTELKIPAGCTALEQIYVQKQVNKLKSLVFEGDCRALQLLDASDNDLAAFNMPVVFEKLRYLYLKGNDNITNIPKEIYAEKPNSAESVKAYLREFIKGKIINERAKLIIVGNGRIGKTSMFRCLNGQSVNPNEKYTHGIQIGSLNETQLPKVKTDKLQLSVWDFGGQEIFYAAHQFFLTDDAVYILAWTNEKNVVEYRQREKDELPFEDTFRDAGNWLDNIRLHGKQSPIIMVQTHYDCSKNRLKAESSFETDYNVLSLNFSSTTKFNLEELKELIAEKLNEDIRGYGQEIATTYVSVIEKIEALKNTGKKRIPFEEFETLCTLAKIDAGGEVDVLKYLNRIGLVVYFDKAALKDVVFIDPNWLTHQVYRLINKNLKDGKIDAQYLSENLKEYTPKETQQLMELLESFKLVFKVKAENFYIAPQYLPTQLEDNAQRFFNAALKRTALAFVFKFSKFMPDNVMINFLSHYGPYSDKVYWKSGIYFTEEKTGVECIVQYYEDSKSLRVYTSKAGFDDKDLQNNQILQKGIFDALVDLSKNAAAELSLDGNIFVSWQVLLENAEDWKDNQNHTFRYNNSRIFLKDYALFLGREFGQMFNKTLHEATEKSTQDMNTLQFDNGYALLVGIGYEGGHWKPKHRLHGTLNDVKDIATLLKHPKKAAYKSDNVLLVTETMATAQGILNALSQLAQKTRNDADATVIVYYSGHGIVDKMGKSYLVPYDYRGIGQNTVESKVFAQKINAINAKKLLVILDCCHSENMTSEKQLDFSDDFLTTLVNDLNTEFDTPSVSERNFTPQTMQSGGGRIILTSCRGNETSLDLGSNGLFTQVLLECLNGQNNRSNDGWVRLEDLLRIRTIVPQRAAQYMKNDRPFQQNPLFKRIDNLTSEEFIICAYDIAKAKSFEETPPTYVELPVEVVPPNPLTDFKRELGKDIDNNELYDVFDKIKNSSFKYNKNLLVTLEEEYISSGSPSVAFVKRLTAFIGTLR